MNKSHRDIKPESIKNKYVVIYTTIGVLIAVTIGVYLDNIDIKNQLIGVFIGWLFTMSGYTIGSIKDMRYD